jgi:mRNA-degrading endonuclease RelE of RelBE toxin-antitoxin system
LILKENAGEITMSWKKIVKRKSKKLNVEDSNIFNKFVKDLTDGLIDRELQDHLSRTTSDDPQYKNHEIALKEVLYDDLSDNIADRLADAIETVVFKEGRIDYDDNASSSGILVLIEAIDKNEKELESKNLEW